MMIILMIVEAEGLTRSENIYGDHAAVNFGQGKRALVIEALGQRY